MEITHYHNIAIKLARASQSFSWPTITNLDNSCNINLRPLTKPNYARLAVGNVSNV